MLTKLNSYYLLYAAFKNNSQGISVIFSSVNTFKERTFHVKIMINLNTKSWGFDFGRPVLETGLAEVLHAVTKHAKAFRK